MCLLKVQHQWSNDNNITRWKLVREVGMKWFYFREKQYKVIKCTFAKRNIYECFSWLRLRTELKVFTGQLFDVYLDSKKVSMFTQIKQFCQHDQCCRVPLTRGNIVTINRAWNLNASFRITPNMIRLYYCCCLHTWSSNFHSLCSS